MADDLQDMMSFIAGSNAYRLLSPVVLEDLPAPRCFYVTTFEHFFPEQGPAPADPAFGCRRRQPGFAGPGRHTAAFNGGGQEGLTVFSGQLVDKRPEAKCKGLFRGQ